MKSVKMFLAMAIVLTSTHAFAASVCTVSYFYYECDGKTVAGNPSKGLNMTSILQDLVTRGYKIVGIIGAKPMDSQYTLIKE